MKFSQLLRFKSFSILDLTRKTKFLTFNLRKFYQSKILDSNSLMFSHKKEIDRHQKFLSKMNPPNEISSIDYVDEIDFQPGLNYFTDDKSDFQFYSKANPKIIRNTKIESICPSDCWTQLVIPFGKNPNLASKYRLLHTNILRSGKLMELLDYFSARVAYKFVNFSAKSNEYTLVTASVDKFEIIKKFSLDKSLSISAYPTWNSDSTVEIRLDICEISCNVNKENISEMNNAATFWGSAFFLYVARDAKNYKLKKKVPKLIPSGEMPEAEIQKANLRFEIGDQNKKERLLESTRSQSLIPPSLEESLILHEIMKDSKVNPSKYKPMVDTKLEKNILLQSQAQNIHGKVFGGYIMRMALELGFVTAYHHSGCKVLPELLCVDRVNFMKPAEIGSIGLYQAMVCFVYEKLIHISVECYNYKGDEKVLTNTVDLTYLSQNENTYVFPTLYENVDKFLEGKRKMENLFVY